jgi:hypothetical protein
LIKVAIIATAEDFEADEAANGDTEITIIQVKTSLVKTRGQIFSQAPTSVQTHIFLIPNYEGTFF